MGAGRGGGGHPSLDIVSSRGTQLAGRRIVLCVAGSVAAYKAIELARLLMRHGADVTCVASGAATRLVRPDYFKWATGNEVVTRLGGGLEHVRLADYGRSDLIVAYPATANTLGKLAAGIDDTPVSTVLTVGLGSDVPVVLCPAMHESMYENAAVRRNIEFLRDKVRLVGPVVREGKARAPEPEDVLAEILGNFGASPVLKGKRVLMTAGPTIEYIDPVRAITNLSSGRTGVLLAAGLVSAGARVTLVYGPGSEPPPAGARTIRVGTAAEMHAAAKRQLSSKKFDIVIMAAAAADYVPERYSKSKIKSSQESLVVRLRRAPKTIDLVRRYQRDAFLVGFKAEADVPRDRLERLARRRMEETGADMMVANDVGAAYQRDTGRNSVLIIGGGRTRRTGRRPKEAIARIIRDEIEGRLR